MQLTVDSTCLSAQAFIKIVAQGNPAHLPGHLAVVC